jgi:hypothetical protein
VTYLLSAVCYQQSAEYLSYAAPAGDGLYKVNTLTEQTGFYTNSNSPVYSQGENSFYAKTDFEKSPLNRVEKIMAPGNSWAGSNRGVVNKYWSNTIADNVRMWTVANAVNGFGSYTNINNASYPAGELYKNVTEDEHGKQVIEFTDKGGQTILKKVQLTAVADNGTGSGYAGWLCTQYIYDDLNQLRAVIQPKAVEAMQNSGIWSLDQIKLDELCFRYEYDKMERMIIKKVPGAGEVYMVYDARDRMVMTQDANLRTTNKWIVTLYDALNRPEQTGLLLNTYNNNTFSQHLNAAALSFTYPFTGSATPSTTYWEYLTKTGYDDYSSMPSSGGLTSTLDNSFINSTYLNTTYNISPDYAQQPLQSLQTRGMITWTEVKVTGTSNFLYSVIIYDDKGRVIQVKNKNITGGTDLVTTQYSWNSQPLIVIQKQEKAGTPTQTSIVVTKMTYDNLGRVTQVDKKVQNSLVNGNALPAVWT